MRNITRRTFSATLCACTCFGAQVIAPQAWAGKDDALKSLKSMADFVSSQKTISATFDASLEVVTPDLEKIQFNNSGEILLARPDKFKGHRVGGYADVEVTFDGKTATLLGKNLNAYSQIESAGTTDQMFDRLRSEFGMQLPGADLLLTDAYNVLAEDVVEAKFIGYGVIGGVECEHLAFRNDDTDWQLWVRTGPQPIPCKMVISSKAVTGAPQYTLLIKDWKTDAAVPADAFAFKAPDGAKKVKLDELSDIDEIPAGTVKGERK